MAPVGGGASGRAAFAPGLSTLKQAASSRSPKDGAAMRVEAAGFAASAAGGAAGAAGNAASAGPRGAAAAGGWPAAADKASYLDDFATPADNDPRG